jgi:hypothetical protein
MGGARFSLLRYGTTPTKNHFIDTRKGVDSIQRGKPLIFFGRLHAGAYPYLIIYAISSEPHRRTPDNHHKRRATIAHPGDV